MLGFVIGAIANCSTIYAVQGPITDSIGLGDIRIRLTDVASDMVAPNYLTHSGDGTGRLFVVDQAGEIGLIHNGSLAATPYLDLSSLLVPLGGIIQPFQDPFRDFDERGLLGLAFHPDFASNGTSGFGKFYTYTSEPVAGAADFTVTLPQGESFNHQSVVREWTVDPTLNAVTGANSRMVMTIDQPQFNHDGGMLAFGQDRQLYISLGDGGGGGDDDSGHGTTGNGQDPTNVLGSILRIDPLGNNSANSQYGIPSDNPFVGSSTVVNEIFATGLRNPFRFSFDGNQLIVADVGQSNIEEIDIVQAGDNLGWRIKEGSFFYDHETNAVSDVPFGSLPPGFDPVDPVLEYDHDEGISVIGGFVYRGTEIPELVGKYVFGDFSNSGFFTPGGRLFYGDLTTGEILEFRLDTGAPLGLYVKGFGEDENGELYLLGGTNLGPFRDENGQGFGVALRFSPVPEPNTALFTCIVIGLMAIRRKKQRVV